ncbi:MAG: alpha/beta family hydrolase [Steroidobacteraceae bacterium]
MSFQPPRPERLEIAGPVGVLEALLEQPEGAGAPPAFGVICHPHPLFGGTMTNKVVHMLARSCHALGVPTLRFNFRGVGGSAGQYDEGRGETDDALAVVAHGRGLWPGASLWLAGFSFGAYVALRAAPRAAAARLVTVAPPVGRWDFASVDPPVCPWLVVQGDRDELVDAAVVQAWAARQPTPPQFALLSGAEHFFHGRLHELRDAVGRFLTDPA